MSNRSGVKNADMACSTLPDVKVGQRPRNNMGDIDGLAKHLNKKYHEMRDGTVQGFIAFGNELLAAQDKVGYGRFGRWCDERYKAGELDVTYRSVKRYVRIAKWSLEKGHTVAFLPADIEAIDTVLRLDDDDRQQLIKDGTIGPKATRSDIAYAVKKKKRQQKHQQIAENSKFSAMAQIKEASSP
jgi:hypothetical protein